MATIRTIGGRRMHAGDKQATTLSQCGAFVCNSLLGLGFGALVFRVRIVRGRPIAPTLGLVFVRIALVTGARHVGVVVN